MKTGKLVWTILFVAAAAIVSAQPVLEPSTLRISIENDFFNTRGNGTDRYYTNGLRMEYLFSKEKARFPSNLLIRISDDENLYSWGVAQYMFTPSSIDVEEVQYDDRPYAGALFAIHSLHSFDHRNKIRLTSEIFLGVIGPMSFAGETQKWVHEVINDDIPMGWDNQVPNDIIINYNLQVEKQLLFVPGKLQVSGIVETFNGTLYNAMDAGFTLKIGKFRNCLQPEDFRAGEKKRRSQIYVYMKPTVRVVYSNALLQGGIITNLRNDPGGYSLHKDQLERINAFYDVGLVYQRPRFGISIMQKMRTAEFKGGAAQEVGNITMAFKL